MKNRTVIGAICMAMAIVVTFLVAPIVNKLSSDTTEVIRLSSDIKQGVQITSDDLETVNVKSDSVPSGIINDPEQIIGKYAASALYAGDYLTNAKLAGEPNSASDVFASLDGSKLAVSVTINTFASGLSGKLENGDIVSIIVTDKENESTVIPDALKYLKVITTTTAGGIDQDSIIKNEDGSYEVPSTVTLLVNEEQARLLAQYEADAALTVALVYRGTAENAKKFLDIQEEYFLTMQTTETTAPSGTETEVSTEPTSVYVKEPTQSEATDMSEAVNTDE